jgi:DNA-binding response OmpR family regulator
VTARIIVIDDDPVLTDTIIAVLESEGYEAQGYTHPQQALQALRRSAPDLLILDILMPRMDGLTLTSLIRKESEFSINLLSAKGEPSARTIGLRMGADDYIAKPFDVEELVARVDMILRRTAAKTPAERGVQQAPGTRRCTQGRLERGMKSSSASAISSSTFDHAS